MKEKRILVTGSLAFDHIMDFPGRFADHILPNKIHTLNVSFLVETLEKQWGGTAGNIAYNLSLLGEKALVLSSAGRDFPPYARHLKRFGVDLSGVFISKEQLTSTAFVMTDKSDSQIAGFYLGPMKEARTLLIKKVTPKPQIAIISPNDPVAMVRYCRECRNLNIPFIFDPGQQIPSLKSIDIINCIEGAEVVIGNDYEIELIKRKIGLSQKNILAKVNRALIVTRGVEGSVIFTKGERLVIPAVKAQPAVDPTGAGDAYRAGLVKGLVRNWDWLTTGRASSLAAVYAVEKYGTQEHDYSATEFRQRYETTFGKFPRYAYN